MSDFEVRFDCIWAYSPWLSCLPIRRYCEIFIKCHFHVRFCSWFWQLKSLHSPLAKCIFNSKTLKYAIFHSFWFVRTYFLFVNLIFHSWVLLHHFKPSFELLPQDVFIWNAILAFKHFSKFVLHIFFKLSLNILMHLIIFYFSFWFISSLSSS
jgi:hypothetical protein